MTVVFGGAEFPAYVIDDETLREELLDEEETREWVEETPDDPHSVAFLRMLGELDRALAAGRARLLEGEPGSTAWATAAVRLAHVHHWREEYAEAHDLLDAAAEVFTGDDARTALMLQHRAKALFDEGRYAEARAAAGEALALLERAGEAPGRRGAAGGGGAGEGAGAVDRGLVASSRQAVARIERELPASSP